MPVNKSSPITEMKGLLSWVCCLPEEVKLDGGVLGLDQGPETPEEM